MARLFLSLLMLFTLGACSAQTAPKTLVLQYEDFGPPSAASELIGMDWWQWQEHGDSRPRHYDIKVVVYRDVGLRTVQQLFPTEPAREVDYRYVSYSDAVRYLDRMTEENAIESITLRLKETHQRITDNLGEVERRE
ncbi:MAG: hypothetical protein P8166_01585 [Candidatus Thiodiazotropha sp.]